MSDQKILYVAMGIAFVFLLIYAISFSGTPVSNQTSDWGAFGSYAAICVSSLSIALIYVTYREQRRTNEITRIEQHIMTMTNTLVVLSNKYHEKLEVFYDNFLEHFKDSSFETSDWNYDKIATICKYYYSTAIDDNHKEDFNYLFQYMQLCIDYILFERNLSTGTKHLRITEFACIFPESMRILLFCWSLNNNRPKIENYFKAGIFMLDETSPYLLKYIISYVCTKKQPTQMTRSSVKINDIVLEDYPNEHFSETYKRFYSNKKHVGYTL
jgi:hypothetical protein